MKTCSRCTEAKPETEFYKQHTAKGTMYRQSWCKTCSRTAAAINAKKPENQKKIQERRRQHYAKIKAFMYSYKDQPCFDCHQTFPPEIMDFHHIKKKSFKVSSAGSRSLKELKREIDKCVVLCPTCHRLRHYNVS